jgi:hypothetical protein
MDDYTVKPLDTTHVACLRPTRGETQRRLERRLVHVGRSGVGEEASFLYNGTRSLFERAGFEYQRPKGKYHCVMRLNVPSS